MLVGGSDHHPTYVHTYVFPTDVIHRGRGKVMMACTRAKTNVFYPENKSRLDFSDFI